MPDRLPPDLKVLDAGGREVALTDLCAERAAVLCFLRHFG